MASPIKKLDFRAFMPLRKERAERFQNGDPEISGADSSRAIAKALQDIAEARAAAAAEGENQ